MWFGVKKFITIKGPLRSELKRMEQFKNQGDETSNSTPGDLGMGMMRIPGTVGLFIIVLISINDNLF